MADIVNLNRVRKARARAAASVEAAENRVRFGRTKEERATIADEEARTARRIDGHRREPTAPETGAKPGAEPPRKT